MKKLTSYIKLASNDVEVCVETEKSHNLREVDRKTLKA